MATGSSRQSSESRLKSRCRQASRTAGILGSAVGALSLAKGLLSVGELTLPLALVLAGPAVWLSGNQSLRKRVLSYVCATSFAALGLAAFLSERVSSISALILLLVTCSLFLIAGKQAIPGQLLACAGAATCALDLKNRLLGTGTSSGLPIPSSIALLFLCAGILLLRPDSGLLATVLSPAKGGHMARRLFPVAVFTLMVAGWLWRTRAPHGFATNLLLPLLLVALVGSFIWTSASLLNQVDAERLLANLKAQATESHYESLVESLPQLVWTCTADGACDYLSPQWLAYTGLPASPQLQWGWLAQIHPEERAALGTELSAIRTGKPFQLELRIRRHDGQYRWFQANATPLRDVAGRIVKWFGCSTDIHDLLATRITLEREQQRLANLVELAPAVFCTFAFNQDGIPCLPYASPGVLDLLGVAAHDLKIDATGLLGLIHQDDFGRVFAFLITPTAAGSQWNGEFRIHHPKKGERWIEGHCAQASDEEGVVWHGFFSDITERKRVQADDQFLLDLGAQLQTANSPEAILRLSARMLVQHFTVACSSFCSIDVLGNKITRLCEFKNGEPAPPGLTVHPLSLWADERTMRLLASGSTLAIANTATDPIAAGRYSTVFQLRDVGAAIILPWRREGEWVYMVSLIVLGPREWTRREIDLARSAVDQIWPCYEAARARAAEGIMLEALASSEERLRLALASGAIGIWEAGSTMQAVFMDPGIRAVFGFPPNLELRRETLFSRVHPEDRAFVERAIQAFIDPSGPGRFSLEFRILRWNDASLRHIYSQGQVFFAGEANNRQPARALGTMQDVTALKQGEEALRRANRELEQFAYAAAHDLQEPLRNVALTTQLLAKRYRGRLDSDADDLLQVAAKEPLRLQAMVKDLLIFSRAVQSDEASVGAADSNAALARALTNLQAAIQDKQATLSSDILPAVQMSESHLVLIFEHLIENALKYSSGKSPSIHVSSALRRGIRTFSVQDSGPGIPAQYREHVFGVFKRLHDRTVPGTGIGLALCRRIVEHYGGKIWIESASGEGTTVLFTPPLAVEKQSRITSA